ncbi:UDP-glucosyltransferase 2-like isoform X2 [Leptopilina heterotoma]|nr:UDP-glucosyltransferase 2-like isoform X2 [Leptopilina heterotoma]XP_043483365.1 UDP-glucosyltransferase 2-like isoform X2 [Leptopilina heterotoma]XP_043483366.1 UDP-glucosyltransferase 2-like isoform X2 [Leptopilina heterotoma]
MKALAKHGHQVDVIVINEPENPPENYTVIYNMLEIVPYIVTDVTIEYLSTNYSKDPVKFISHEMGNSVCELLANRKVQDIIKKLKTNADYDLLVTEAFGVNCFMGLAHFLNIPLVTLSAQNLYPWVEDAIGYPSSSATHPTILSSLLAINFFWVRLQNTLEKLTMQYKLHYSTDKIQTELIRKYINRDLPTVSELAESSLLTLSNTHFSFYGVKSTIPALVEVGGLHILQDETKLTPELQKWMNESNHGVIYFSLGTIFRIDSLANETIHAFYSVMRKLKPIQFLVRVKYEDNLPPGIPDNVRTLPWIPQIPILRHKNTKVFITHCGLLSSLEAVYFGVPVIGIPIVADQFINLDTLVKKNMGIKLDLNNIKETILFNVLMEILSNSSYRKAAKIASKIFKDRPMNPEESTIYWIEYVLRNGGILRSPAINLHWIQKELLDVYGFLLFLLTSFLYMLMKIIQIIVNCKLKNKSKRMEKKNN